MPKVEIIKQDIIVLHPENISEDDSYFHFASQDGTTYRIKKNRVSAIELIKNNLGKAVRLNYGSYMETEYIHAVDLVADELPDAVKPAIDMNPPQAHPVQPSGQEVGMWWKQLGDDLRSGHIDKSMPQGKLLRAAYFAQMFSVLNIKIEKGG